MQLANNGCEVHGVETIWPANTVKTNNIHWIVQVAKTMQRTSGFHDYFIHAINHGGGWRAEFTIGRTNITLAIWAVL